MPQVKPVEVTTTQAVVATVPRQREFVGNIRAQEQVILRARVTGFLEEVNFRGGDMVTKGQELFQIEKEPFVFRKDQAQALVEKATAELKLSEGNYRRAIEAHKSGGITDEELAENQAKYYQAKATLEDARQQLSLTEQDLSYTSVKAPFDGQVSRNLVDAGNLVNGSGEGAELATVITTDPMNVYFDVPENLVNLLRQKYGKIKLDKEDAAKIGVMLDGESDYVHEGWIDYVDIAIDQATGTAEVRGVVPNPNNLLQPGQYARVMVYGDPLENAILVREEAVGNDLRGQYLLTVDDDGLVHKKPVELGGLYMKNEMRRVIPIESAQMDEGVGPFSADDWYIARGLAKAFPGMKVEAKQDKQLGQPPQNANQ